MRLYAPLFFLHALCALSFALGAGFGCSGDSDSDMAPDAEVVEGLMDTGTAPEDADTGGGDDASVEEGDTGADESCEPDPSASSYAQSACPDPSTRYVCERFFKPATYDCSPLACEEFQDNVAGVELTTGFCASDTCQNPIVVDARNLPFSLTLDGLDAFDSDFDEFPGCSSTLDWSGPDLVFRIDGLSRGQVLEIDASEEVGNMRDSYVVVADSCQGGDVSCLDAEDIRDRLEWISTVDGSVFVIIDRLRRTPETVDGAFAVTIE